MNNFLNEPRYVVWYQSLVTHLFDGGCSGSVLHGGSAVSHWFSHGSDWWRAISTTEQLPCWHLVHILCTCPLDNCCVRVVCRKSLFATFLITKTFCSIMCTSHFCSFLNCCVRFICGTETKLQNVCALVYNTEVALFILVQWLVHVNVHKFCAMYVNWYYSRFV